jgi:hypothetical protein
VGRTGSALCAVTGFGIRVLNRCVLLPEIDKKSNLDHREICCEDGSWMDLAEDRVH